MTEPRSWEIRLVYSKPPLSLNDRSPWQVRWRNARLLRDRVRVMAQHVGIPRLEAVHVEMFWTPKTRRTRDVDNLVATLKPAIDGLRDYPAGYKDGRLVTPAYRGVVADDDPTRVTWAPPVLTDPDPLATERLTFRITERTSQ